MPDTFTLEIATPEKLLVHEQASEAQIPGVDGELGILPGHAALLSELGVGPLSYTANGRKRYLAIEGGWVEVNGNHVRVLATSAENADAIDASRAEAALTRAMDRLAHPDVALDVTRALNAAKRARARLDARKYAGV